MLWKTGKDSYINTVEAVISPERLVCELVIMHEEWLYKLPHVVLNLISFSGGD